LVEWALEDWAAASGGRLIWKRASSPIGALFHIRWAAPHDQQHGVAQPFLSGRRHGSTIRIRPDLSRFPGAVGERGRADALYRDTVVYLTALHELGHGLGMNHAAAPGPIMYNGRLLPQVFSRYRTRLKSRSDIRRFSAVTEFDRNRLSALLFARSTTSRPPE
ncbi:MAG TPA: hypothetical protein DEH78_10105, partial [Solibacterales bacterium]|nr:hypothetical protein [Bryobacterales bacterium]